MKKTINSMRYIFLFSMAGFNLAEWQLFRKCLEIIKVLKKNFLIMFVFFLLFSHENNIFYHQQHLINNKLKF